MGLLQRRELRASSIQMAADRRWDAAIDPLTMSVSELEGWVARASGDVAIECIFRDGLDQFGGHIGFRRTIPGHPERMAFWRSVLQWVACLAGLSPESVAARMLDGFGLTGLISSPPREIELGLFNQWVSAGPVKLPQGHLTRSVIDEGPEWLRSGAETPICREEVWYSPERVWIAEVISPYMNGRYVLPTSLIEDS